MTAILLFVAVSSVLAGGVQDAAPQEVAAGSPLALTLAPAKKVEVSYVPKVDGEVSIWVRAADTPLTLSVVDASGKTVKSTRSDKASAAEAASIKVEVVGGTAGWLTQPASAATAENRRVRNAFRRRCFEFAGGTTEHGRDTQQGTEP